MILFDEFRWLMRDHEPVPEGPMKVGLVAIAVERVPELATRLPIRPHKRS